MAAARICITTTLYHFAKQQAIVTRSEADLASIEDSEAWDAKFEACFAPSERSLCLHDSGYSPKSEKDKGQSPPGCCSRRRRSTMLGLQRSGSQDRRSA